MAPAGVQRNLLVIAALCCFVTCSADIVKHRGRSSWHCRSCGSALQAPGEGRTVTATVICDTSDDAWPPVFTVRLPDARTLDVPHTAFTAVGLPPRQRQQQQSGWQGAAASAPDALPSVAPTLPGAPLLGQSLLSFSGLCLRSPCCQILAMRQCGKECQHVASSILCCDAATPRIA
jgi:hypothetical protein